MTDVKELGPLDYRIAITDQQGRPSPEFQRRWDAQRINNGLFVTLTFGTGAPTDPATKDGSEYIDTSTTPYTLYVVRTGAWHKVGPYAFTDLSDVPHSYSGAGLKLVRVNTGATALEFSTIAAALDSIGSTQGDILYRNATGWTVLPPGTASQLLQTGGASANPSWVNAPTSLPSIANNTLLANTSGSAAVPVSTTLTALIDSALGSAQGDIIYRNASGWVVLTPGTSGYLLATGGASANPSWTAPIAAANPTATASDTAVNGSATTFMRSDASPAIQKASSSVFGLVKVDGTTITATGGVISGTASVSGANPTATASDTAVNGSAATFMRSDAAPAIQKTSSSVFGLAKVDGTTITATGGVISSVGGASGANPTATASDTAVNGSAATFMRSDASPAIQKGSSSQFGVLKVDGTTITASSGVISGVAGTTNNYYAGALTLLETHTASSSAELDFTAWYSSSYDSYLVEIVDLVVATNTANLTLQVSTDGGSTYVATGYAYGIHRMNTSASETTTNSNSDTSINIGNSLSNSSSFSYSGSLHFWNPASSRGKNITYDYIALDSGSNVVWGKGGGYSGTAAYNAFRIKASSGNITTGTVRIYGISASGNITVNPQPGLPVISETVTSGSQSSVTISSIPSTYRDLRIVVSGRGTTAAANVNVNLQFNGDSGANYDRNDTETNGSSTGIGALAASTSMTIGYLAAATATASVGDTIESTVGNYAGTTFQKAVVSSSTLKISTATSGMYVIRSSGWWRSTAAITSLTLTPSAGAFVDGTVITVYGIGGSPTATLPVVPPQGRLTLTSGAPVMTADATAQGTVYYAPYVGTLLPVGNIMYRFSQLSYVLNTTAHTSTNLYDVFAYNSSGTITLATGPAWTNSTTRSNAISQDATNGIWVNTSSITLNLSGGTTTTTVAAGQATYLGTFYATANGQTGMAFKPTAASGGTNNILGLWNAYNRVTIRGQNQDSAASWSYATNTWRALDNSSSNRISYVDGLGQSSVSARLMAEAKTSPWAVGLSQDSTSATPTIQAQANIISDYMAQIAIGEWSPTLGFHYIQAQEKAPGGGTANFVGSPNEGLTIMLEM